jgi:hypothetical protein
MEYMPFLVKRYKLTRENRKLLEINQVNYITSVVLIFVELELR